MLRLVATCTAARRQQYLAILEKKRMKELLASSSDILFLSDFFASALTIIGLLTARIPPGLIGRRPFASLSLLARLMSTSWSLGSLKTSGLLKNSGLYARGCLTFPF